MCRPSFQQIYMDLALHLSQRSTCNRPIMGGFGVGCVISSPDFRTILSVGYNGNATKLPNKCDSTEPGKCGCLHAEENAIISCDFPRAHPKVVFCTHLPCVMCAKRLLQLGGVEKVYYLYDYRIRDSEAILESQGIKVCSFVSDANLRIRGEELA